MAKAQTPQEMAARRAHYLTGLLWHVGAFVIINALFWFLDLATGAPGVQWAIWITVFWGSALAFHALAYAVDGRQVEQRTTQKLLDAERGRAR